MWVSRASVPLAQSADHDVDELAETAWTGTLTPDLRAPTRAEVVRHPETHASRERVRSYGFASMRRLSPVEISRRPGGHSRPSETLRTLNVENCPENQRSFREWIDVDDVLDRVTHDWDFLNEMVDLFTGHAPGMLEAIERAVTQQDAHEAKLSAHALKGAIACWSTRKPYRLVVELENLAGQNRLSAASSLLKDLRVQVDGLISALREFVTDGAAADGRTAATNPHCQGI